MGANQSTGQPGKPPQSKSQPKGNDGDQEKEKDEQKKHGDLVYDENEDKYYDPLSGESVIAPGKYDPEPEKRPLRVKVRKRQHFTLRKRRKPPKPVPLPQSPDPPTPPKALRPPTIYDEDGYAIYYDEWGHRIEYDENGHLIPPEPYYDEYYDDYIDPGYDDYGNLIVYDAFGIPVDNDINGDPVEYDRYGYPIEYDEEGNPIERTYYPKYDEFGNEIPPKKKKEPKFEYPDDGYDYDDSIYTYTTLESPIPRTPSPVSSDDVQEKDDSGDDLSMEDVTEFTWRPFQPVMPKEEARALIKTGGEDCSCFPKRSNPMIPSMVYDQVTCPHTNNVIGHAHAAVIRFDDNWNDRYTRVHRPKRHDRQRSKVTSVWGYPHKQFPDYKPGEEIFEGGLRGEFQKPTSQPVDGAKVATADKKTESATGSQKPDNKSNTQKAADMKKDDKKSKDKKSKKKEDPKKKTADAKADKDKKTKEDKSKTGQSDKKSDANKEDKDDKAKEDKSKTSQSDKKADANKKADPQPKADSKKSNRKLTTEKDGTGEKKDADKKEDRKKNVGPSAEEPGSKQGDDKKAAEALKNADTKSDKPKPLSRDKQEQAKVVPNPKMVEPPKGKGADRAGNQSRDTPVVKSFLPKIGYTPDHPFSNAKARSPSPDLDTRKETENFSLPPIPASPAYSMVSSMTATTQDFYHHPDIPASRKFEGKYYDPVTKKTYTYEIKPRFGKNVQDWDALRQV